MTSFAEKSLAEKSIISGGDHKPPMLERDLYDSWKNRIEFYILNQSNGRMLLHALREGPMPWPTTTLEDGTIRPKTFLELTPEEKTRDEADIRVVNIILQGIPPEYYALVSQYKSAKEIWEKLEIIMQGTSLTKQERDSKLYDSFDMFTSIPGESLKDYYTRFTLVLNNCSTHQMIIQPFQMNHKFLNALPQDWKKIVTDVKLVKDMHTTNPDQLYAYLSQLEPHVLEQRLHQERTQDSLALMAQQAQFQEHRHPSHHFSSVQPSHVQPSSVQPSQTTFPTTTTSLASPRSGMEFHNGYLPYEYPSYLQQPINYTPQSSIPQITYGQSQNVQVTQEAPGLQLPVFNQNDNPH